MVCLKKMRDEHSGNEEYPSLCLQGESTIMKRKEMLPESRKCCANPSGSWRNSIDYIDWKQNFYDEVLSGKRPVCQQPDLL